MIKQTLATLAVLYLGGCDLSVGKISHAQESKGDITPAGFSYRKMSHADPLKLHCSFTDEGKGMYLCAPERLDIIPLLPAFEYDDEMRIRVKLQQR